MSLFKNQTFKYLDHLKICLPLYLYNIRISGVGSFEIGVSLFNLLLPFLLLFYIHKINKLVFLKATIFFIYILFISLYNEILNLKVLNFLLGSFFLIIYFEYTIKNKSSISHFTYGLSIYFFISFILYIVELSFPVKLNALFFDRYFIFPRFSGLFIEPSHAGIGAALLFFSIIKKFKKNFKFLYKSYLLILITTIQSFFGYLYGLFLFLNKKLFFFLIVISSVIIFIQTDINQFINNSGLVRLFGIFYFFENLNLITFLGNGIGQGTLLFTQIGEDLFGLELFNGFMTDLIYDIGILGFLLLIILMSFNKKNKLTFLLIFVILNLNFGIVVSIFPFFLSFSYLLLLKEEK